ncbi:unnamed protein product [Urochloa humidicola]
MQQSSSPPVILLVVTAVAAIILAAVAAPPPMGLPGCPTSCGKVTVPYPFGIGTNCSLPGFNLTCDDHTFDPPRLFLGAPTDNRVQVIDISLEKFTVRVVPSAVIQNSTTNSIPSIGSFRWGFLHGSGGDDDDHGVGPLVYSYHLNKFFVIGCKIQATLHRLSDAENNPLITGCSSFCSRESQYRGWAPGGAGCRKCHGNGCCMAAITSFYPFYIVRTRGLDVDDVDPWIQNLVVIGEKKWMEKVWCRMIGGKQLQEAPEAGARQGMMLPADLSMIPVVLEWAMDSTPASTDNTTRCPKDGANSACKSKHSSCNEVRSPFHRGYVCHCLPGFHGNPYLTDGCQDIDECADAEHYGCYGECTNMPGTFQCRCRHGFQGNASMIHGCVKSSQGN